MEHFELSLKLILCFPLLSSAENKEELPEATDIHTVRPIRNIQRIGPNPSSIAYSTSQTMNQASKQAKSLHHPSNISVSSPKSKVNTFTTLKSWTVASDFSNHPVDVISDETALFNDTNLDSSSTGSAIKVERNEDYDDDPVKLRQNVDVLSDNQMNCEHAKNAEQTLHPEVPSHDLAEGTETVVHENEPKTFDISSVKLEPGTKDDLDIEITCVQKDNSGMDMSDGNWTSSVSYGSSSEHQFQVVNDMLSKYKHILITFNGFWSQASKIQLFLAHRIKISESLPWDRKSYLAYSILPRNHLTSSCEIASLRLLEAYFKKIKIK